MKAFHPKSWMSTLRSFARRVSCSALVRAGLLVLLSVAIGVPDVLALEPPRPGEMEKLRATGQLERQMEAALAIGNHRVDSALARRAVEKQKSRIRLPNPAASIRESGALDPLRGEALPPARVGMPTKGNVKIFALLIDFNDYHHSNDASAVHAKLFGAGSPSGADFPYESLAKYYDRSSYGQLLLYSGTTLGWYRPAYGRSTIDQSYAGREALIKEALDYYDQQGHDFSQYDNDGDGSVDYFIVIWSGPAGNWASFWWGYYTGWWDSSFVLDGKHLTRYAWLWESTTGETFYSKVSIHETGHGLGLPDLYDYNDSVGPRGGVGGFDMMDHNLGDLNCFSKWLLDWITPTVVSEGWPTIELKPSGTNADAVLIMPEADGSTPFSEYFMVQNRSFAGNDDDASFQYFLTEGLWVWHVDASLNSGGSSFQFDNSFTEHKLLRLMEADGLEEIEQNLSMNAGDVYIPGTRLGDGTFPSSRRYGGQATGILMSDISSSTEGLVATLAVVGKLASHHYHNLLIKGDGSLWAWGYNVYGQLGSGSTSTYRSTPGQVGSDTDWRAAAAGAFHSLAIKSDGTLWAWGYNAYGQLGDGTETQRLTPVQVGTDTDWVAVTGGQYHSVALKADGTLWSWGDNYYGSLGQGLSGGPAQSTPARIGTDTDWAAVDTKYYHSLALKTDGTLWGWGYNNHYTLGTGNGLNQVAPIQIGGDSDWAVVATGYYHTLAVKRDGSLWAWGSNGYGQYGNGGTTASYLPLRVGSDDDWSQMSAGWYHSVGLKRDGSMWATGSNSVGQLGDGTNTQSKYWKEVAMDAGIDYVHAAGNTTFAITLDTNLSDTGLNNYGQLGDGTVANEKQYQRLLTTLPVWAYINGVPATQQFVGLPATFTAGAAGYTYPDYQYQFRRNGIVVRDYATDNAWIWNTSGASPGNYKITVNARNAGSIAAEGSTSTSYKLVTGTATSVTLVPSPASPQPRGASVTVTAQAAGGTGSYEYQFRLSGTVVRDYASISTWTWDSREYAAGAYSLVVWARCVGSTRSYDTYKNISYTLTAPLPATSATLSASPASPQPRGTTVLLTAQASGGSGLYEYQFRLSGTVMRAYARDNTWTWDTHEYAAGDYGLVVWVRSVGSASSYDTYKNISYTVKGPLAATAVTLSASPVSSQPRGTPVLLTAQASGGSGLYEYQFRLKNAATGLDQVVRSYARANSWTWETLGYASGGYTVIVWARSVGSTSPYDTYAAMGYTVSLTPASSTTLSANPSGPKPVGTSVLFSAQAAGGTGYYEYKFLMLRPGESLYTTVRDYDAAKTWNWNSGCEKAGTYSIKVHARSVGSTRLYDAQESMTYKLEALPVTQVTLVPSLTSPQPVGAAVLFTSQAAGGTGCYEYQFRVSGAVLRDYSPANTWTWQTTGKSAGGYTVVVWARNTGSSASYEAYKAVGYTLTAP